MMIDRNAEVSSSTLPCLIEIHCKPDEAQTAAVTTAMYTSHGNASSYTTTHVKIEVNCSLNLSAESR